MSMLLEDELLNEPIPLDLMIGPSKQDILCGQDTTFKRHHGNVKFRELISTYHERYCNANNKVEKMNITKDIVQTLKETHRSRFLKRSKDGEWQELTDQKARDKVSHALRFAFSQPSTPTAKRKTRKPNLKKDGTPRSPRKPRKHTRRHSTTAVVVSDGSITEPPPQLDKEDVLQLQKQLSLPADVFEMEMQSRVGEPLPFEEEKTEGAAALMLDIELGCDELGDELLKEPVSEDWDIAFTLPLPALPDLSPLKPDDEQAIAVTN